MRERLFPGKPRRYWWADYRFWAEIWDAVIARNPVGTVAAADEHLDPRTAERGSPDGWADPCGPGRCPRCKGFLGHEAQYVWSVRQRSTADTVAAVILCDEWHERRAGYLEATHAAPMTGEGSLGRVPLWTRRLRGTLAPS